MTGAAIQLEKVSFGYEETRVHFDIVVEAGSVTAIMGPSGAGKTTLLNLIAGFEIPDRGIILIGGSDVTGLGPAMRPVSMVFQENNLFAHLSVEKNVGLGRSASLKLNEADHSAIRDALARTGLSGKEKRLPSELSGGERQRVALARVLVRDRPVLLLDEPFASLGPALREDMIGLLADLNRERAMTVIFVTHQPEDARRIARSMIFIEAGTVAASGPVGLFFGNDAPAPFKRYIGSDDSAQFARKRT